MIAMITLTSYTAQRTTANHHHPQPAHRPNVAEVSRHVDLQSVSRLHRITLLHSRRWARVSHSRLDRDGGYIVLLLALNRLCRRGVDLLLPVARYRLSGSGWPRSLRRDDWSRWDDYRGEDEAEDAEDEVRDDSA